MNRFSLLRGFALAAALFVAALHSRSEEALAADAQQTSTDQSGSNFTPLPFEPETWKQGTPLSANCWQYVIEDREGILTQLINTNPGAFSGVRMPGIDETEEQVREYMDHGIIPAAIADGLEFTGRKLVLRPWSYPVALFVTPGIHFHWMRLNEDMTWSDKMPFLPPALYLDKDKRPIKGADIVNHDRGSYKFVGFFNVHRTPDGGLKLNISQDSLLRRIEHVRGLSDEQRVLRIRAILDGVPKTFVIPIRKPGPTPAREPAALLPQ